MDQTNLLVSVKIQCPLDIDQRLLGLLQLSWMTDQGSLMNFELNTSAFICVADIKKLPDI